MENGGRQGVRNTNGQAESAVRYVIHPLIRSCRRVGLTADAIRAVVDIALAETHDAGEVQERRTDPRPRRDLADLAHVLSAWHTRPDYVDDNGAPLMLRRHGSPPSFEALARSANPSLDPDLTLERLLLAGAVSLASDQQIRVERRELVAREWDELGLWSWHETARRLLETLEFNYVAAGIGRFERAARSERLPRTLLPVFNAWVREHAEEFLRAADDWLTQHEGADAEADDVATVTTGVGIYIFVDEPEKSS